MTEEEIVNLYRYARDRVHQIHILTELTLLKPQEIVRILLRNGIPPEDIPSKQRPSRYICAQCGEKITGAPNARYCPRCAKERLRESYRRSREKREAERRANL